MVALSVVRFVTAGQPRRIRYCVGGGNAIVIEFEVTEINHILLLVETPEFYTATDCHESFWKSSYFRKTKGYRSLGAGFPARQ